jgi:Cdc6-like AAA superfamily ATPase
MTGDALELCRQCRKHRLNRLEREILVALVLHKLALVDGRSSPDCRDVIRLLCVPRDRTLEVLRYLSVDEKLVGSSLVTLEDEDDGPGERVLEIDPVLIEAVLSERRDARGGTLARCERDLYLRLANLAVILRRKSEELDDLISGIGSASEHYTLRRKAESLAQKVEDVLERNPGWALAGFLRRPELARSRNARTIVLILLSRELGHLGWEDLLFQGGGIARALARRAEEIPGKMRLLRSRGNLVLRGIIRQVGESTERASFELTNQSRTLLGLESRTPRRVREASLRMNQLVLSDSVRRAVSAALAQARHANVMIGRWGLGEIIPYGRAVTLLFTGPPGVGKTACAEAMAHELGRPVLVADYAQIQNCYVGKTEKNIAEVFRTARSNNAVLFWDEADAMFYNRDIASRSWEIRDVNVLLQELERFDGVCVLATNRRTSLDPALERRITLKVEFECPDRGMRSEIWKKLLPRKLPLSTNVEIERLAEWELTGAQIKNVLLNAARLTLTRGARGPVRMADFLEAVAMEQGAGWAGRAAGIGFRK